MNIGIKKSDFFNEQIYFRQLQRRLLMHIALFSTLTIWNMLITQRKIIQKLYYMKIHCAIDYWFWMSWSWVSCHRLLESHWPSTFMQKYIKSLCIRQLSQLLLVIVLSCNWLLIQLSSFLSVWYLEMHRTEFKIIFRTTKKYYQLGRFAK